jgi:hypothetical protein
MVFLRFAQNLELQETLLSPGKSTPGKRPGSGINQLSDNHRRSILLLRSNVTKAFGMSMKGSA